MFRFDVKNLIQVYLIIMCIAFPVVALATMGFVGHQMMEIKEEDAAEPAVEEKLEEVVAEEEKHA